MQIFYMEEKAITCVHCDSDEVTYNNAAKDSYCAECGRWQEGECTPLTPTEILDGLQRNLAGRDRTRDDQIPSDAQYWAKLLTDRALWILGASQHHDT